MNACIYAYVSESTRMHAVRRGHVYLKGHSWHSSPGKKIH